VIADNLEVVALNYWLWTNNVCYNW